MSDEQNLANDTSKLDAGLDAGLDTGLDTELDTGEDIGVVLCAAGNSSRFGRDKRFLLVGDIPLWQFVLERFIRYDGFGKILVGLEESYDKSQNSNHNNNQNNSHNNNYGMVIASIIEETSLGLVDHYIGGATRAETVRRGVELLENDYVVLHDVARPFFSNSALAKAVAAAKKVGGAVLGTYSTDTIYLVDDSKVADIPADDTVKVSNIDRNRVFMAYTPQVFKRELLLECYQKLDSAGVSLSSFTDEGSILSYFGHQIALILDSRDNIKITYEEDADKIGVLARKYY